MIGRPLVSIITPTIPERHELLGGLLSNLDAQDYPDLEHLIVSDGPGPKVHLAQSLGKLSAQRRRHTFELGRHWSAVLPVHALGVAPILTGLLLARGEYLAWLCDDEAFVTPDALSQLVGLLESTDSDFVYPRVRMWWKGSSPDQGWDIGTPTPEYGQFTWCLFRASLLQKAMPRFDAPTFNDADLMNRWRVEGARHAFLDRVLVTHRADR